MRYPIFIVFIVALLIDTSAVQSQITLQPYQQRTELAEGSSLKNYPARNIGPVVQGGRIVDIAVNESNKKEYYLAYASGGLFKTTNNGVTFESIFDNQDAIGLGDIALAPSNPEILYVGTGENNSSRSSYAGSGIYKSIDAGSSWQHLGLTNTQHIGRIVVHPKNPEVLWVASMGALYSHNEDRGVYKSTDGGKNWEKTLYINDSTGIIDLIINPDNPDQLWASSWERTRQAWNFKGNGPGSAIYRSDNGGKTWFKTMDGFPNGPQVGRIGLAVAESKPNIIYAFLDNQAEVDKPAPGKVNDGLKTSDFLKFNISDVIALQDKELDEFLKDNNYPKKYTSKIVKSDLKEGKYQPKAIANYFGDANAALFNTSVVGAELYRSDDSGITWKKMNSYDLDGVYFTYGYYFGEVRVSPKDENLVYLVGFPVLKSTDGGVTYSRLDSVGDVHVDHHAMWIDNTDPQHVLLGNDGGLYESYDEGANWRHINNMSVGQFYTVNVDMEKPYNVYGGLQDNGTLVGSSRSVPNRTRKWERLFGGDGMFVAPDPRNSDIVYVGFQFGNYFKINRQTGKRERITLQHDIGEAKLRFNWRTPVKLSSHNADIIYMGSQKLHRSFDQGKSWQEISPDLTKDRPQGNVPYSTISTIGESPLSFSVIYVGTDDGNVQVTRSGGTNWTLINNGLPKDLWVSSVVASPHNLGQVFVTLNGYRNDDFKTYIYVSNNYGENWQSLKSNLPDVVVNDLIQDPVNPDLLYLGTDHGTYISIDAGNKWELVTAIPNVPAYDLIVHPRDNELIVATHGKSMYVMDVKPLQNIAGQSGFGIKAFDLRSIKFSENWGEKRLPYLKLSEPRITLKYFNEKDTQAITITVLNDKGQIIRTLNGSGEKGFHHLKWNGKVAFPVKKRSKSPAVEVYIPKGKYQVKFSNGTASESLSLEVK